MSSGGSIKAMNDTIKNNRNLVKKRRRFFEGMKVMPDDIPERQPLLLKNHSEAQVKLFIEKAEFQRRKVLRKRLFLIGILLLIAIALTLVLKDLEVY